MNNWDIGRLDEETDNLNLSKFDEEIDLKNFIRNFVFSNWQFIDYKYKVEDIILDLENEDEEYINDEEIFYKGILYI